MFDFVCEMVADFKLMMLLILASLNVHYIVSVFTEVYAFVIQSSRCMLTNKYSSDTIIIIYYSSSILTVIHWLDHIIYMAHIENKFVATRNDSSMTQCCHMLSVRTLFSTQVSDTI